MKLTYEDYLKMMEKIRSLTDFVPKTGVVLGSGLDGILSEVKIIRTIPYTEIDKLPQSTNKAHKGCFVFATYNDIPLVFMQGRLHLYEGYTSEEVTSPIRLMKLMGIENLILTNACGGITYGPGTMMLMKDHISCMVPSPLIGNNIDEFGPRFPDMSDPYSDKISDEIYSRALEENLPVSRGVYMQFTGPQYESRAEVQLAKRLGADAVGMSTAIEGIVSNHMGIQTLAIATISNWACGIKEGKLCDEEVLEAGKKIGPDFTKLLKIALTVLHHGK